MVRVTLLDYRTERETVVGDFEWVQFTYGDLGVAPNGDPIKGLVQGDPKKGRAEEWRWKGKWYSDLLLLPTPATTQSNDAEVKAARERIVSLATQGKARNVEFDQAIDAYEQAMSKGMVPISLLP